MIGRPVSNRYKVPKKTWNKWNELARRVFNRLYESMRPSMQWAFHHPESSLLKKEHWATLRWNAAFEAAHSVNGDYPLLRVVENGVTYGPNKRPVKRK